LEIFSGLDTFISLTFIQTYPHLSLPPNSAMTNSRNSYRNTIILKPKKWPACYNRLKADLSSRQLRTPWTFSIHKLKLWPPCRKVQLRCKVTWQKHLTQLYLLHPDRAIFAQLPAARCFLEPALLAKLGDDRNRLPQPTGLTGYWQAPVRVTEKSSKKQWVHYSLGSVTGNSAIFVSNGPMLTIEVSPWAEAYYKM